jgi:hypothetical protein
VARAIGKVLLFVGAISMLIATLANLDHLGAAGKILLLPVFFLIVAWVMPKVLSFWPN